MLAHLGIGQLECVKEWRKDLLRENRVIARFEVSIELIQPETRTRRNLDSQPSGKLLAGHGYILNSGRDPIQPVRSMCLLSSANRLDRLRQKEFPAAARRLG